MFQNLEVSKIISIFAPMNARRDKHKQYRSQLNSQLAAIEDAKEKEHQIRELDIWKSEVLTDLAKLIFAGVIIGGIFENVETPIVLYGAGVLGFTIALLLGYMYYKRGISKT